MAKLTTKDIREIAKKILEGHPTGHRFTQLWKQIASDNPETNQNTIFTQVSTLARDESATVFKPSRGVYQLAKYAEAGSEKLEVVTTKGSNEIKRDFLSRIFTNHSEIGCETSWKRLP